MLKCLVLSSAVFGVWSEGKFQQPVLHSKGSEAFLPQPKVHTSHEWTTLEEAPMYVCEDGSSPSKEGECVEIRETKAKVTCPDGYRLSGHECSKTHHVKPLEVCPPGATDDGFGKCKFVEIVQATADCPKHYRQEGGACVPMHAEAEPEIKCPHGYDMVGDACAKETSKKPLYSCPHGGQLSHHSCKEEIVVPATCAHGWEETPEGCVKLSHKEPQPKCHGDAVYRDGQCIEKISQHPDVFCANGQQDKHGKKCIVTQTVPLEVSCRHGYELQGDRCVKYMEDEPKIGCPHGYKRHEDLCVKEIHDKEALKEVCPDGMVMERNRCVAEIPHMVEFECKHGELVGGQCVIKSHGDKRECEKHFRLRDGVCVREQKSPAVPICEEGFESDGKCKIISTTAPEVSCGWGEDMDPATGMCITAKTKELEFACPKHFRLIDGSCVKESKVKAELQCEAGFQLHGKKCESLMTAPVSLKCDDDEEASGDACLKFKSRPAKKTCPGDYVLKGDRCELKLKVEVQKVTTKRLTDEVHPHHTKKSDKHH